MKKYLNLLVEKQSLTKEQAQEALLQIGQGEANHSQIAAFLMGIQQKGITVDELEGFREAMLSLAVPLNLIEFDAMDIVGTGGDGKDTFNISTTSAFVLAGAGQRVAKHGNHGVSSSVGSSTVLEHLGVKFTNDESFLKQKLETAGICYMHAPLFHPAMKYVAPIRKELGMKTFFNILGPLLNPAKVQKQFSGVYNQPVFELYAELFGRSAAKFAIIYDLAGYDEISLTDNFQISTHTNKIKQVLDPQSFGFGPQKQSDIYGGGTIEESAEILLNVLNNQATAAQTNVVLANAGFALCIAQNISVEEGIARAKESIESGKALNSMKKLIQ
ncbi:Anthranilate phosphoribosyltransferase [Emticicia oligotrophica DSM 17448]|uniref:Anthranilate phosphoribosyltransferase n=1 Tax=Emticicia oligotrophica (strain DSM 17448 / CIP 109782 / MTCC 6937 / GPTSA100-15) TaxID=929562 RepID=A0ABN4ALN6_EMTOG|nr:anthranilate phosphoribosyltransferase [Emticicia oligotrophica]AFK03223.1 Anthranilate phosphoribosyltransferase [Emticicia oligotrophica DSM 17448]